MGLNFSESEQAWTKISSSRRLIHAGRASSTWRPRRLPKELDALHAAYPKPMIFTEFGAEALPGSHDTPPEMWSEEYQADTISRYLDVAAQPSYMMGTLMWCFADFKTSQHPHQRHEQ